MLCTIRLGWFYLKTFLLVAKLQKGVKVSEQMSSVYSNQMLGIRVFIYPFFSVVGGYQDLVLPLLFYSKFLIMTFEECGC